MQKTNITLPDGLPEKAHELGVNISRVCTIAVEQTVKKLENAAVRDEPSKEHPETATAGTHTEASAK